MSGYALYSTSSTNTATDGTWRAWASSDNATTASSNTIWYSWNGTILQTAVTAPDPIALTDEEIARRQVLEQDYQQRQAEARERQQQDKERREQAEARSKELLKSFLTPDQIRSLEEQSNFLVESESKRLFKIRKQNNYGVLEVDQEGKSLAKFCANFGWNGADEIPVYDLMLAQKLMLENNEALFLSIANREAMRL